jgi:transposase InsO family protein
VENAHYPVTVLCKVLQVRTSGYYAWLGREESKTSKANSRLAVEVTAAFKQFKGRYGSPRLHHELHVCRHRVARLMREQKLCARPRRKFCKTTNSNHDWKTPKNLLKRNFNVTEPNRVWVGDVTYLPTKEGWLYLAVLLDLYSRKVVGWAMSERNDEALTLAALQMALDHRRPMPGLIHHSDRGTTYASGEYQDVLARNGVIASMSRKGNCWDNAVAESFFSTLDFECGDQQLFTSRATARREVVEYLLGFYNPTRLHSHLGYMSPMDFERAAR